MIMGKSNDKRCTSSIECWALCPCHSCSHEAEDESMLNKARQKQQWNGRLGGTWVYCLHRKSARQSVTEDRELQLLQVCLKFFLNLFVIYPQIFSPLKKFSIFFACHFAFFGGWFWLSFGTLPSGSYLRTVTMSAHGGKKVPMRQVSKHRGRRWRRWRRYTKQRENVEIHICSSTPEKMITIFFRVGMCAFYTRKKRSKSSKNPGEWSMDLKGRRQIPMIGLHVEEAEGSFPGRVNNFEPEKQWMS